MYSGCGSFKWLSGSYISNKTHVGPLAAEKKRWSSFALCIMNSFSNVPLVWFCNKTKLKLKKKKDIKKFFPYFIVCGRKEKNIHMTHTTEFQSDYLVSNLKVHTNSLFHTTKGTAKLVLWTRLMGLGLWINIQKYKSKNI